MQYRKKSVAAVTSIFFKYLSRLIIYTRHHIIQPMSIKIDAFGFFAMFKRQ
jgi:hypothetical protein